MYRFLTTLFKVVLIYLVLLIYEVTLPNPYSAATHFGGVTDWYLEPRQGYIADSDPEEDEEDPEEDPADHPADGGDNDDNESADDDDDNDDVEKDEEEEEEEEHLAPADPSAVPTDDHVPPPLKAVGCAEAVIDWWSLLDTSTHYIFVFKTNPM
ncbi:hypothetical protein Tco_0508925 [Tanacetum coccineum]